MKALAGERGVADRGCGTDAALAECVERNGRGVNVESREEGVEDAWEGSCESESRHSAADEAEEDSDYN